MSHTTQHILDESTLEAQKAAKLIGGTFEQGGVDPITGEFTGGFTPITGEALTPVPEIDFVTPEPTPIFPIVDLDTTLTLTEPEREVSELSKRLQALQEQEVGEAEFRAREEERVGIPELLKTQTDLASRLKAIQAEAKAIPLQLQKEAEGRGITVGGLRPLQTARLRENAIQALGISSLLEASRGNITTALDLIDRQVATKFDPIREEINAVRANLNLILESPEFSLAEKNRAQKQLEIQNQRDREREAEEENFKAIQKIAIDAAAQGADAIVLRQIQAQTDPIEAQRLATEAIGISEEDVPPRDKPLTINQIEQFRRSFGWTPPLGFSRTQLEQFIADNPGATPEELEKGAKVFAKEEVEEIPEVPIPEIPTPEEIPEIVKTPEETITFILDTMTDEQLKALKKKADEAGVSSFLKSKRTDVKNYLNSIKDLIQRALDDGLTMEKILEILTE